MLGLQLRKEFRNKILKGTAIDFNDEVNKSANEFLDMTYPSSDLIKTIESTAHQQSRPVVLIGDRGQGKSHLLTALYHSFVNSNETKIWLENWSVKLKRPELSQINLRENMFVIAESLQRQNYKFLWDLLLERHPSGEYIKGKWEGQGDKQTEVLGYDLVLEMVQRQPTVIILDEFQTWYDALTNTKQYPWKNWAFNFIQILSEIAEEYPHLLVLVVSVRNGQTDAYQQIHRRNPSIIDFKGQYAKRDRKRLLLHRLFENRSQIVDQEIFDFIQTHLSEYYRLLKIHETQREFVQNDFIESWPFSPQLLQLLEDQILISTDAQETRDLIKILADLYKQQTENTRVITAASFSISNEGANITTLLDSMSNEYHKTLREKAQRNLEAVYDAVNDKSQIKNAENIISALWLRSLAIDKLAGAERSVLQVDITQSVPIDDNSFLIEITSIINNSFNIHEEGNKLIFKEEENPQAKLMAFARNDRLFQDKSDFKRLAKEIAYVLWGSEENTSKYRVIVLNDQWQTNPWEELNEAEQPSRWDNRIPVVVIPENSNKIEEQLGKWLSEHISVNRNTIRFLLLKPGATNVYRDTELLIMTRAIMKADEWKQNEPEYRPLYKQYQDMLRSYLNTLFDRFAILDIWNFNDPKQCQFHIEPHQAKGKEILDAVDSFIKQSIFEPEDFNEIVMKMAERNESVAKLLADLKEPRPGGKECIPWLGEVEIKEKLIRLCTKGKISIDIRGMEQLTIQAGESEEIAWNRMKGKLGTGSHLNQSYIQLPSVSPSSSFINTRSTNTNVISGTTNFTPQSNPNPFPSGSTLFGNGGSSIYTGSSSSGSEGVQNAHVQTLSADATSSLNLMGKVEGWGINAGTNLKSISINIGEMTGAQLQQLLRSLPDGLTYGLKLDKEEK